MRKFERIVFTDEERRNDEYEDLKMLHEQLKYFLSSFMGLKDSDIYRYAEKLYELTDMSVKMGQDRFNSLINSLSNRLCLDEDDYEKYLDEDGYEEPVAERWFEEDDDEEPESEEDDDEEREDTGEKDSEKYKKDRADLQQMMKHIEKVGIGWWQTSYMSCIMTLHEFLCKAIELNDRDFKQLSKLFDDFYKENETDEPFWFDKVYEIHTHLTHYDKKGFLSVSDVLEAAGIDVDDYGKVNPYKFWCGDEQEYVKSACREAMHNYNESRNKNFNDYVERDIANRRFEMCSKALQDFDEQL